MPILRIVEREWFDTKAWTVRYGYEVVFQNGVVLLKKVDDEFQGPSYLLPLINLSDSKEAVLADCQYWVDHNQTKVKTELHRVRQSKGEK